jgi:hypothetical protein
MPIDLNKLPHTHTEFLPDLNQQPVPQVQEEEHHLQVNFKGWQPLPDLNEESAHGQGRQPLPDLNEEPAHGQDEEGQVYVQAHLQQGQPLPELNGDPTHDQEEVNHLQEGQSQPLMQDGQLGVHGIDLNVEASMGELQPHEGDLFLLTAYVQQQEHPHYDLS